LDSGKTKGRTECGRHTQRKRFLGPKSDGEKMRQKRVGHPLRWRHARAGQVAKRGQEGDFD